jgi:hypothetical protein
MTATKIHLFARLNRTIASVVIVGTFAQAALCGEFDWPQWQGPDRTAQSRETGLLQEWPKDGPPLAWKVTGLGGGDSAPSVAAPDPRKARLDVIELVANAAKTAKPH